VASGDGRGATIKRVLENGLTVLVRSRRQAPIGSFWVWYKVGARNEVPGITGISHWAEHMLFKGTEKYGKGEIFRTITAAGGSLNGFTWLDYTAYFENLPIDRIDLALDIEADRMVNARFDPEEVAGERTVIISEKRGSDNQPTTLLREEVASAAIRAHPYRQGVIGYLSDLQAITREDLYRHYQTYYRPNNAVAVFVGDLETDEAVERIERAFGELEAGPEPPAVRTREPEQYGERRVTVRRPAPNRVVQWAHYATTAVDEDAPALLVLDAVLSGGKGLGFGGTGGMGRSSRLYRALVASGLCASAGSSFALTIDPYLFGLSAVLRPETASERVEEIFREQIEALATEPVGAEELQRAKKQMRAQYAYGQESVGGQASLLGSLAIVAPERSPESLIDDVTAVSAEDVQRVAMRYLTEQRRTVGWLIPTDPAPGPSSAPSVVAPPSGYTPDAADLGLDEDMPVVRETRLANGIRVVTLEPNASSANESVSIRVRLPGGSALDDGRPGIANFTADVTTRGSGGRTLDELAEILDGLGASIGVQVAREVIDYTAKALVEDADRVTGLLATTILAPDFPADQIEVVRGQILSALRQARNDTRSEAERLLRELLYPVGHPYRGRVAGTEESVAAFNRDDLVGFHELAFAPSQAIVAVAGGLSHEAAVALMERNLGGWQGTAPELVIPDPGSAPDAGRAEIGLPGKVQADIAAGARAIARSNPDFYALSTANLILGRLGLMGRLGESVRERQGMAYYAFSALEVGTGVGFWSARAGVDPGNIERAIESIREVVREFLEDGPTDEEMNDARGHLTGSMPLGLETSDSIARIVADIIFSNLGHDYLRRYRGIINALTEDELTTAARRYINPDRLAIAVAKPEA
jgi:zinc protease